MKTKTKELPKQTDAKGVTLSKKGCPRCGSSRIYTSDEDFICLACSYIVLRSRA